MKVIMINECAEEKESPALNDNEDSDDEDLCQDRDAALDQIVDNNVDVMDLDHHRDCNEQEKEKNLTFLSGNNLTEYERKELKSLKLC
jgi:hypothetical protein